MTAAIITASASIVVAVLAFLLSQRAQIRQERRQARLARINSQLRDLYGPLNTLVDTNEQIWEALRATILPARDERSPEASTSEWRKWRDQALMPTNRRMRELIIEHADLIIESEVPQPLRDFCAHISSLEVAIFEEAEGVRRRTLIEHPGSDFTSYVHTSFVRLKEEQQRLLGRST
ncbi:hypothetical protein [Streptomyces sp. S465]|uniref:hypothetical protein n=1 Tax=Streptomyces sp. S465 TaxID=2979468 RepID=UPI0022A885B8|nr:hypothetical protein [Streptomyces sp. S465]WAP57830.1 hypothetical protein N6H00_24310 [Streptomyces sp. S465]